MTAMEVERCLRLSNDHYDVYYSIQVISNDNVVRM